jgi:predicted phosphodiesterase
MALYGVLGDIHGNREALLAALTALEAHQPDRIVCVGDIVGYNADPDDCAAILREREIASIAGNHDLIATGRLGLGRCSNKAIHSLKRTRRRLSPGTAQYLRSLPAALPIEEHVVLVHGGVRDVQQYMTKPHHIAENVGYLRSDFPGRRICFFGHMHEQKVFEVEPDGTVRDLAVGGTVKLRSDAEYFVNPGSVDASRKHEHKEAEFALFDSRALTVRFFRVPYDDALTERKAAEGGYRIDPWRDLFYSLRRRILAKLTR